MSRKYVFFTKWDRHNMLCACLFHNPCCKDTRNCEEIELTLNPYDDIEECMRARRYEKRNGKIIQK